MKTKTAVSVVYWVLTFFVFSIFYFGISKKFFLKYKGDRYKPKLTAIGHISSPLKLNSTIAKFTMAVDSETRRLRENKIESISTLSEE